MGFNIGVEMKKSLLIFSTTALMFFVCKQNSSPIFSVNSYRFIQTGVLSDDYFSSVTMYATQLLNDNYSTHGFITQLKKKFAVLDKIDVAYRPCGTYIMMHTDKPLCCINQDQILTVHNQLFPKDYFSYPLLDSLSHVTIAENCFSKIVPLIPSLLSELPADFNQTYDLELLNEHCLYMRNKQEKTFNIIATATQKKLSPLLAQCALVKKKLAERKDFNAKTNWIADIRFADYIIAYKT